MSFVGHETLVGITDISEMAQVSRAAASNWPKRYPDFPKPRVVSPSGALFDAGEVERWLLIKGKITGPIPAEVRLWKMLDRLRDVWTPADILEFVVGCIVYVNAKRRETKADTADVGDGRVWPDLGEGLADISRDRLLAAAREVERTDARLKGVLTRSLDRQPPLDAALLANLLETVLAACQETPLDEIFDEAMGRLATMDRSFASHETPGPVAELMVRLALPIRGMVFDPAAGTGGLLEMAALHPDSKSKPATLIGYERDDRLARFAQASCYVHKVDAHIVHRDSLRSAADLDVRADLVLLDPPWAQRDWGDEDIYLASDVWRFGLPSPNSADFAWLQLAVNALNPDGRALVVLPAASVTRGGRSERIRSKLVRAGCVDAVIFLPARFARGTAVPLSLWVMRPPQDERSDWMQPSGAVLLVDATRLGARHPRDEWPDELEIEDIVHVVHFSEGPVVLDASIAISVPIEQIAEDANLSFTHYQPLPAPPDLGELSRETDTVLRSLEETLGRLAQRTNELAALLREQR
ncbi:MAG: HsdM family class I SAM-dependent methyltransferase [Acidimicrobiales bacterium]